MIIERRNNFLMSVLNCGFADLKLIDGVGYEWNEILAYADNIEIESSLRSIMEKVFHYGFDKIWVAIDDRICELEAITNERNMDESEETELKELQSLNPHEDFSVYYNYLDTHVYCEKHKAAYRMYLRDALDDFLDGTGFEIEGIYDFDDFLDDEEKMKDFKELSKDEFLFSYSYLTEEEYDLTEKRYRERLK